MTRFVPCDSILRKILAVACVLAFASVQAPVALAQRGGAHVGGGHFGGGGHMNVPRVAPHLAGVGTGSFIAPPVRLMQPPRITSPIPVHAGIRFPYRPIFPIRPVFPIFHPPVFGLFGWTFFGFGLGFGFNSFWGPTCGPFWGWGFGCNALPFYDYSYGNYGALYAPGNVENELENQKGPMMYENPPPIAAPLYLYGEESHVQLYLKDGTVYNVTDYWLVNDQLHFRTIEDGGTKSVERVIDFDQLDLQKSIDVNTQRGFRFVLRNEPLEQYLQDHPDGTPSGSPPETGPTGPLPPPQP